MENQQRPREEQPKSGGPKQKPETPGRSRIRTTRSGPLWLVIAIAVVATGATAVAGYLVGRWQAAFPAAAPVSAAAHSQTAQRTVWTCSMHPQIKLPKPGKCPICFMDLIPLTKDADDNDNPRQLKMSAAAMALADIQTSPVQRKWVSNIVRMVGKVDYDETRLVDSTAWVPGRLDRLYVDYTGVMVRKGDHLFHIYSPDLVVAQDELLLNWRAYQKSTDRTRQQAMSNVKMSEDKLRLWGLLDEQIEEIKRRGTASDHVTIYAPVGGIVVQKYRNEGAYVKEGTPIYTIADLSLVWIYLDAYESDLAWLRYGQNVEFTTESYPGNVFHGRIAFIDPVLNEKTRTVKVRVNVPNKNFVLKPGMFVRATVKSRLAAGGRVLDPSLAGKWICPMHPEVVKDAAPGGKPPTCDVCGMDMVPAEELGFIASAGSQEPPLVIPATAPLITGRRAVVYVKLPDAEKPTFEGREIVLGQRAGDYYLVRAGLREGEQVVTQGNFKIDSALEIKAEPSMMNPQDEPPLDVPGAFRQQLAGLYDAYLKLQASLADDRPDDAIAARAQMRRALANIRPDQLDGRALDAWQAARADLDENLAAQPEATAIDEIREQFEALSGTMLTIVDAFGHTEPTALYKAFCPMAFHNKGAVWLQAGDTIANPYFGHKMLHCGEIQRTFAAAQSPAANQGSVKEDQP